ncbi:MAG: hypothetical protein ACI89X_002027 [Planctomycetota bacterium]|jgi:hypothetical protein
MSNRLLALAATAAFATTASAQFCSDNTYPIHIVDVAGNEMPIDGMDEVVSENDSMDRFIHVENNAGVITLTFAFSSDPSALTLGAGLNGAGKSLLFNPFRAS